MTKSSEANTNTAGDQGAAKATAESDNLLGRQGQTKQDASGAGDAGAAGAEKTSEKVDEKKAAETKPGDGAKTEGEADKKAPSVEDIKIVLPDGKAASDADVALAKDFAKQVGITDGDQLSKALAWKLKQDEASAKAFVEAELKAEAQRNKEWLDEIKADKKIGGDKLPATKANIQRFHAWAIELLGNESLLDAIDSSGQGNNPALVRVFAAIGAQLAEDRSKLPGEGDKGTKLTDEQVRERFYRAPTKQHAG